MAQPQKRKPRPRLGRAGGKSPDRPSRRQGTKRGLIGTGPRRDSIPARVARHIRALVGYVVFACILLSSLLQANWVMESKWVEHERLSIISGQEAFYATEPDSLDVLFMGTSHAFYSFSPQMLYDEYGITSHNLGTCAQTMLATRWWVEEAVKRQSPKAIVLETFAFPWELNSEYTRMALNGMRWSATKVDAMLDLARGLDEDPSSYLMSNLLFHDRWEELEQNDFTGTECAPELRGWLPAFWADGGEGFQPLSEEIGEDPEKLSDYVRGQLDRICEVCYLNDIKLVLVTVPSKSWTQEAHDMTAKYVSEKHGVEYYDLNCAGLYGEIGYDYENDATDEGGHANVDGARKMTSWVGRLLTSGDYAIEPHEDESFEASHAYLEQSLAEGELFRSKDIDGYIGNIDLSNHVVLAASPSGMEEEVREVGKRWLEELGLEPTDGAFVAIAGSTEGADGEELRLIDDEELSGILEGGLVAYAMDCTEGLPSMTVTAGSGVKRNLMPMDGTEKWRGMVFVTYDPVHQVMVDRRLLKANDYTGEVEMHRMM